MKGAILEVLLVSAQGINHKNIIGNPNYYVIIECGAQVCRSKTSEGNDDKIYWNEKFTFELGSSELENLSRLKLKIMDEEYFINDGFVGETMIYLKGIVVEGNYRGLIELNPVPFNVVLEDDTYKGQIKIGLKFIPNIVLQEEGREQVHEKNDIGKSISKTMTSLWQGEWWNFLFFYRKTNSTDKVQTNLKSS